MLVTVELDWADDERTDEEIFSLAKKYHLTGRRVGQVNDWPTYHFFGEEKKVKRFMKREYDPDSVRDFDCYVVGQYVGEDENGYE